MEANWRIRDKVEKGNYVNVKEYWSKLVMNEDSHLCAVPVIPIDVRRCMRIVWSIVSNAEERSSSASIVPFLLSRLVRITLDIFASAVSVYLEGRNALWKI